MLKYIIFVTFGDNSTLFESFSYLFGKYDYAIFSSILVSNCYNILDFALVALVSSR